MIDLKEKEVFILKLGSLMFLISKLKGVSPRNFISAIVYYSENGEKYTPFPNISEDRTSRIVNNNSKVHNLIKGSSNNSYLMEALAEELKKSLENKSKSVKVCQDIISLNLTSGSEKEKQKQMRENTAKYYKKKQYNNIDELVSDIIENTIVCSLKSDQSESDYYKEKIDSLDGFGEESAKGLNVLNSTSKESVEELKNLNSESKKSAEKLKILNYINLNTTLKLGKTSLTSCDSVIEDFTNDFTKIINECMNCDPTAQPTRVAFLDQLEITLDQWNSKRCIIRDSKLKEIIYDIIDKLSQYNNLFNEKYIIQLANDNFIYFCKREKEDLEYFEKILIPKSLTLRTKIGQLWLEFGNYISQTN